MSTPQFIEEFRWTLPSFVAEKTHVSNCEEFFQFFWFPQALVTSHGHSILLLLFAFLHLQGPSGLVSGRVDDASGSCVLATTKEEEDRELQVPRARSLQETTTTQSIEENLAEDVQRAKKSQGQAKLSAEDVAAVAAERLPAEPTPPDGCRIGELLHIVLCN